MKFKVGDRIRFISDKGAVPKGACGTIRKIEIDEGYQVAYDVRLDNKVGKGYCYYAAEKNLESVLEDINEPEEKGKMKWCNAVPLRKSCTFTEYLKIKNYIGED